MSLDFMIYPTFEIVPNRGFIPKIYLPENFEELIPKFYEQRRKRNIKEYIKSIKEENPLKTQIKVQWDNQKGLTSIGVGATGLDLNEKGLPSFQEHNLGGIASFISGAIAIKYISELLKS